MKTPVFAANWKMNHGPTDAKAFMRTFLAHYARRPDRTVIFCFPALPFSLAIASACIAKVRASLPATEASLGSVASERSARDAVFIVMRCTATICAASAASSSFVGRVLATKFSAAFTTEPAPISWLTPVRSEAVTGRSPLRRPI